MSSKLHVIYIPGLGDKNPIVQARAINIWKIYGVEPELFHMKWYDDQPWRGKFDKLLKRIDELHESGQKVALVGVSAGAGAAINAYAARPETICGVVTLSGKIHNPEKIGPKYRKENPSFIESAYAVPDSLKSLDAEARKHIFCRFGLFDEIVPTKDSRIEGAKNLYAPTVLHAPSIAFQITIGAFSLMNFLKKQAKLKNMKI